MINDSVLIVVDMLYDFIDGSLACANSGNAVANTLDFIKKRVTKTSLCSSSATTIRQTTPHSRKTEESGRRTAWQEPAEEKSTKT